MVILCNRNQELRHTGYLQQLIIFPLIIARCAEATLRVLLSCSGMHPRGAAPLTRSGALPLHPARGIMPLDPTLLYNIAPKAAGKPVAFGAFL